jgi:hypothetical protein
MTCQETPKNLLRLLKYDLKQGIATAWELPIMIPPQQYFDGLNAKSFTDPSYFHRVDRIIPIAECLKDVENIKFDVSISDKSTVVYDSPYIPERFNNNYYNDFVVTSTAVDCSLLKTISHLYNNFFVPETPLQPSVIKTVFETHYIYRRNVEKIDEPIIVDARDIKTRLFFN